MPVRAVCPECGATTSIDDPTPGATVTCHQCGGTVAVPVAKAGPPPLPKAGPPPLPAPAPAGAAGFELLVDELDSAVAVATPPRARGRGPEESAGPAVRHSTGSDYEVIEDDEPEPPPARRRPADDGEDDEPEPPRARRRLAAADEDDDVEAVEDDGEGGVPRIRAFVGDYEPGTRPLPRRKGQRGSKSPLLLIAAGLAALVLFAGGGVAAYMMWPDGKGDSPEVVEGGPPPEPGPNPAPPPVPDRLATTVPLPGKAAGVLWRDSWIYAHCPAEQKLVIISLGSKQVSREIPGAGPGTVFAATADDLYVVPPDARAIDRYRPGTPRFKQSIPLAIPGTVKALALGSRSPGPALVVTDQPADAWPVHFLNINSGGPAKVAWGVQPLKELPRDVRVRASADGTAWVVTPRAEDPFKAVGIRLEGNRLNFSLPFREDPGYAVPSADGDAVYSKFGRTPMYAFPKEAPAADPETWRLGVEGTPFEMVVRPAGERAKLSVFAPGHPDPLIADVDIPRPAGRASGLTADQAVGYHPGTGWVLVVPESADRLEMIPATPAKAAVEKYPKPLAAFHTTPPRLFTPGELYQYTPVLSTNGGKPTFATVFAPPGTTVLAETGVVVWRVPKDYMGERTEITLQATTPNGAIAVQTFAIFNTATAPPKTIIPKGTPKKVPDPKGKDPVPDPKKEPDPKKSPEPMVPVVVDPIAPGAKLTNPLPARVAITPPAIPDGCLDVPLGGALRDVCVGGGGKYLIAHIPTARRLAILDVSAGTVVKTISLGADSVLFAAGMSKLIVVYPDEKQVLRYSLPDGDLEKDAELDVRPKPVAAAMGSATAGPLVLGGPVTQNNASKLALTFLDVETLKEVRVDKADGVLRVGFASAVHLRVSADGRTVATWYRQLQPSGLQLIRLAGNTLTGVHKAEGVGHVVPGPHGEAIFTEKGIYNIQGEPAPHKGIVLPAAHGFSFLSLTAGTGGARTVSVLGPPGGSDKPLAEFTTLPGFDGKKDPFERDNPTLALDKRLFLVPEANVLVVVPPAADRFLLYRVAPAKK